MARPQYGAHHTVPSSLHLSISIMRAFTMLSCLQVAKELGDGVQILKLDVDKNPSMSTRLQVGISRG